MARWQRVQDRKRYRVLQRKRHGALRWVCEFENQGRDQESDMVLWNARDEFKAVCEVCRIFYCNRDEVEVEADRERRRREGARHVAALLGEREDGNDG